MIENYEINSPNSGSQKNLPTLLERSCKDFNLFKFLYSHKNPAFKFSNDLLYPYVFVIHNYNPSVLYYLLENENEDDESLFGIFRLICMNFPEKIQLILDFLNESKNAKYVKYFTKNLNVNYYYAILHFYNEETIVKLVKVFPKILSNDSSFLHILTIATSNSISVKMINSLVKKFSEFLPKSIMKAIIKGYENLNIKIRDQFE